MAFSIMHANAITNRAPVKEMITGERPAFLKRWKI
jgi:hypothetical protein